MFIQVAFNGQQHPFKHACAFIRAASAIAGDSCGVAIGRLAVAVKSSGGKAKILVFSVALGVKMPGQGVQLLAQVSITVQ